eukprot:7786793-Lingulodinium_polyedra.AAC.1
MHRQQGSSLVVRPMHIFPPYAQSPQQLEDADEAEDFDEQRQFLQQIAVDRFKAEYQEEHFAQ